MRINESRLEQLSVQNIGRRSWIGPHGESIDIDRHAGEGDTDYHHLHLVVDKPHLFGFTTDELQTIDPFRHRLLKSKTTWGGRAHTWSNAIISEVGKRGWIRAANDTFKDQNSDDIMHHFNLSHHGYEGEHNLKAFIPALKTVRDTIISTQNSKRDPIHVYLEGYDRSTIRRFNVTLRSIESINSFIKNHTDLPKQETKSTHLPIILQQFNSTQTRAMLGRNPPEGIPQAIWNNMRTIGDSYMPIMSFKEFITEQNL